jgi:hypothetical protein
MTHDPAIVEALARYLCRADGKLPDHMIAYEEGCGIWMRRDQPEAGPPIWPEMPLWRWGYEGRAVGILNVVTPMLKGGTDAAAR